MKVIIAGGGVIGLCCALYLKKEGHDVTVVDENTITGGCSFGNMGYISPSHFVPLATPGIIRQGLKWMTSSSSPFYIKPRLNLDLLRWGLAFKRSATSQHVKDSAPHLNNLLQLSRALMSDLKNELPDFDMIELGCWMLYKLNRTGEHEKELAEQAAGFGLKTLICTPQQVQEKERQVEVNVAGGVLYVDDCHIDPAAFMRSLYEQLVKLGVKFWLNTRILGIEKESDRISKVITSQIALSCDELVLANGSWMGELSKKLGIKLLMQPGKGYSMVYDGLQSNLQYPSILVDDRTATSPIRERLRIGGTMELSGHNNKVLPKRVQAIHSAFGKYYPAMKLPQPDTSKAWYGYRPVSPDGLPYIGRHSKYTNLLMAGGHAMLGVSAAAGTGKLIAELVNRKPASIDLSAFQPERFR